MSAQLHGPLALPSGKQLPQLNGGRLRRRKRLGSDGTGEGKGTLNVSSVVRHFTERDLPAPDDDSDMVMLIIQFNSYLFAC
jgi:hypothetical protein